MQPMTLKKAIKNLKKCKGGGRRTDGGRVTLIVGCRCNDATKKLLKNELSKGVGV